MQQRLPSLREVPIAFAHRGAKAIAPENTIEAFSRALEMGATGLESDVWVTADGIAVLDHDGVVRKGLRRHPIAGFARSDLPEHIPALSDLFEQCGTDFELSLDLKAPGVGALVVDTVAAIDPQLLERVWLCDESFDRLVALRAEHPTVRLANTTSVAACKPGPERRAADLAAANIDAVNLHHTDWSGGLVALFHRFERFAFAWDLQFEHQLRPSIRMGIDAVYSDHVDVMLEAIAKET